MKKLTKIFPALILFMTFTANAVLLSAQTSDDKYDDGTVWQVSFIKTMANQDENYLESLADNWVKTQEEAKKQGLIVSYKVLAGSASNPEDFDIMLMVEFKNMAAMEGNDAKWEAIAKSTIGDDAAMELINQKRVNIRTIYGDKLMRELIYK